MEREVILAVRWMLNRNIYPWASRGRRSSLLLVVGLVVLMCTLIAALIWGICHADRRREEDRRGCLNNLRRIYSAQWSEGLVRKLKLGDRLEPMHFSQYLHDARLPDCPSGGSYTIMPLGQYPTCTVHGDLLTSSGDKSGQIRVIH